MALGNLLTQGSYSTVGNIFFDEKIRLLKFRLDVYKDSDKKDIISSLDYTLDPTDLAHQGDPEAKDLEKHQKAFDNIFSSKALSKSGNNLYKAIYKFLKVKDEMSGTTDV